MDDVYSDNSGLTSLVNSLHFWSVLHLLLVLHLWLLGALSASSTRVESYLLMDDTCALCTKFLAGRGRKNVGHG